MPALVGFAPDLDSRTPGIILDMLNVYPTIKGWKPFKKLSAVTVPLPSACKGAYLARYLDGTTRVFAGTATKLYSFNGGWVDVSGAQTFSLGVNDRWRFTIYGNDVIATWRTLGTAVPGAADVPQVATGPAGTFAPLGGSPPRGQVVESVNEFVFLLNTDTATDQWWCSGIGADTTWTPDIATQSANALLGQTDGPITGARRLGSDLIVYKLHSMYIFQYLGPPVIWGVQLLSNETGAPCHEAIVALADRHVFVGWNNFYLYDGNRPQPIPNNPLREYFFEQDLDQNYNYRIIGRWDRGLDLVIWAYPSVNASPAGTLDSEIILHLPTGKWAINRRTIENVLLPEFPYQPGLTYAGFGSVYSTYNDSNLLTLTYASPQFNSINFPGQGIFKTDHALYTFSGDPDSSRITTGDYGDEFKFSQLIRVKPDYESSPEAPVFSGAAASNTLQSLYKTNLGDDLTAGRTANLATQGWFNILRAARYHRFKLESNSDYELIGLEPVFREAGSR